MSNGQNGAYSATVAGSITLDKDAAAITVDDLTLSNAFDATPGGGDVDPGKGDQRTVTPTTISDNPLDVSNERVTVAITSDGFGNGDTLTINGFGADDVLSFDFAQVEFRNAVGNLLQLTATDAQNHIFFIDVNTEHTFSMQEGIAIRGSLDYLDTIFGDGTFVTP